MTSTSWGMWAILLFVAFLSGSLPFSVWIGRWGLKRDIRGVGDHNPGATNVFRAGGKGLGALALLLDMLKGAIPVGVAYFGLGLSGWPLATICWMPVLGHAFSPFLGFQGGKAVAVTGGIWIGLTAWEGITVGGVALLLFFALLTVDGWALMAAQAVLLSYFALTPDSFNGLVQRPDFVSVILPAWLGIVAILIYKHRHDLTQRPDLRLKWRPGPRRRVP